MTRARRRAAATLLALPAVVTAVIECSARAAAPACTLEIVGTWKSADAEQPTLLSFTAEGWANVLGQSPGQRAEDFDILAQVRYELDDPLHPRRLTFTARRGNDVFPAGESSWELVAYDDHSFSVRAEDAESLWTRVETHRYFLTFAHRSAAPADRGAGSLVAWTTLDGHRTVVEAIGVRRERDREPRFALMPLDLVAELTTQRHESDVVLRVAIDTAEYRRSHRMLEAWATLAGAGALPDDDPYGVALDLVQAVLASVNGCRQTILLRREDVVRMDDEGIAAAQRLGDAMRSLRKENAAVHVGNAVPPAK